MKTFNRRAAHLLAMRGAVGPFGALVPRLETRAVEPNPFLNTHAYVNSNPGSGGASITFYEPK